MLAEKEHPYKLINKLVQSGDIPSVIFLYGSERFMIEWAWRKLKDSVIYPATESLDLTVLSEQGTSEGDVIAACETLPFMSERKVVVIKDIDFGAAEKLTDYIKDIPKTTLLILINEKADKRRLFFKEIEKRGLAYDFTPLDEATLASWARKRCDKIAKADLLQFASESGYFDKEREYNLYNLENDLLKAKALYSDKAQISLEELEWISSAKEDDNAFKLLDAAFSNKKGEALRLLHNSISNEQASKQMGVILRFHGLMCSQLEIMLEARQRKEAGRSLSEMKINQYRLNKAIDASSRLSTARLKAALAGCYRIESDIKSGRMDARLAMELFIAKI